MAGLYQQIIMRHYQQPLNKRKITKPDFVFHGANPSCGDNVIIEIKLDTKKKICEVGWSGNGCAISLASASIFSEMILGRKFLQMQKMKSSSLQKSLGLRLSPARLKCALLPLYTVKGFETSEGDVIVKK